MVRIGILLFASGAAGILYQLVWLRLLDDVFGVTVYAVSALLAAFLGGLGLGAWALGPIGDRVASPLKFYGLLELGIALTALPGPWLLSRLDPLHNWAAEAFVQHSLALLAVRLLLASVIVLPPTFLMGGTLPIVARAVTSDLQQLGGQIGRLYAINTVGAVAGALAAGFLLLGTIGVRSTLWLAVAISTVVALTAVWMAGAARSKTETRAIDRQGAKMSRAEARAHFRRSSLHSEDPGRNFLAIVAATGCAALGLEVLWTRALVMIIGTSTYAFVTVLASFLVGIAAGSFAVRNLVQRRANLRTMFGWLQFALAITTLCTVPLLRMLTLGAGRDWIEGLDQQWLLLTFARFDACFLVLLVPTLLMGMSFPVAVGWWAHRGDAVGRCVGQIYAANTLGNVVGALGSGFVVVPLLGVQKGIAAMALLYAGAAAWAFARPANVRLPGRRLLRLAAVAGLTAACVSLFYLWQPPPVALEDDQTSTIFYREGVSATVEVREEVEPPQYRTMFVDGVKIGQSGGGVDRKQQALAHFPFLLRPRHPPRRVLVVGLGTGILPGEVARHREVEAIDCVEIASEVVAAARLYGSDNHHVLDNARVRVVTDDGVNFLRRTRARYDAIISDAKSRHQHAGNSLFYSADYYTLCLARLTGRGQFLQWLPSDMPPSELRIVLNTATSVFPDVQLWMDPPVSLFLVGGASSETLDVASLEQIWQAAALTNLREYGWRDPYDFLSMRIGDHDAQQTLLSGDDPINTLDLPVLEFYSFAAWSVPRHERAAANLEAIRHCRAAANNDNWLIGANLQILHRRSQAVNKLLESLALLHRGDAAASRGGVEAMEAALQLAPEHGLVRRRAAQMYFDQGIVAQLSGDRRSASQSYRRAVDLAKDDARFSQQLQRAISSLGRR